MLVAGLLSAAVTVALYVPAEEVGEDVTEKVTGAVWPGPSDTVPVEKELAQPGGMAPLSVNVRSGQISGSLFVTDIV